MIFSDGYGAFPPHDEADEYGLLAIGATLAQDRLTYAYNSGIFPWYSAGEPVHWYSPAERCVFTKERFHISRSFSRFLNKMPYRITENTAFSEVIRQCAVIRRKGQSADTWIHDEMISAYTKLYESGMAKSVEVWEKGELAGGIYGVEINRVFCGESMFSKKVNASKCALHYLLYSGYYDLLDAQIPNPHLMSLGAFLLPRHEYLQYLKD